MSADLKPVLICRSREGTRQYLQHYSICGNDCFSFFSWSKEDAQRFDDAEHAEWVASHFAGAKVVTA